MQPKVYFLNPRIANLLDFLKTEVSVYARLKKMAVSSKISSPAVSNTIFTCGT